jgi:hypothetical protein
MSPEILDRRALNRALLARQHLLRRAGLPTGGGRADAVIAMVEHLAGLQAQAPFPPYYGLWSRLAGFVPSDLAELLAERRVVRIALMRSTIHLVSARDCLALRPLIQPVLERGMTTGFGRPLEDVGRAELAAAGRALVEAEPRTFSELGALLAGRFPGIDPAALSAGVRTLVPLVQVPPRALWGKAGQARHTSSQAWLGALDGPPAWPAGLPGDGLPPGEPAGMAWLVCRYLAAYGPATVADIQAWSGLTRLRDVVERLRPALVTFASDEGRELFDLPGAPRPGPDTEAPVRLVAEFDNLILSHADRSRVIADDNRKRLYTKNGIFPGTVLVDGFVVGMWRLSRAARAATLTVEMFEDIPRRDRDAIGEEGEQMLGFAAPDAASRDIRLAGIA